MLFTPNTIPFLFIWETQQETQFVVSFEQQVTHLFRTTHFPLCVGILSAVSSPIQFPIPPQKKVFFAYLPQHTSRQTKANPSLIFWKLFFLVACYATLHPALTVRLSVRPSNNPSHFSFFAVYSLTASALLIKWPQIVALPTRTRLG